MQGIYDNGTILLGTKKDIINYMSKVAFDEEDKKEISNYLKDLKDDAIVSINYDFGMGLTIDYWEESDEIK